MIKINDEPKHCHRCGSENLEIINIAPDGDSYTVWCNNCNEETLEDQIKLNKIKEINIHLDK